MSIAGQLQASGRSNEARLLRDEIQRARGSLPEVAGRLKALGLEESAGESLASQERALAAIDEALRRRDPEHALFLIEQVRRTGPDWLTAARPALGIREVRVRLALDQRPSALFLLRDLTLKSEDSRAVVFAAVRAIAAEGDERTAQSLAREIVRLLPDDATAAELLKAIETPQAGGN